MQACVLLLLHAARKHGNRCLSLPIEQDHSVLSPKRNDHVSCALLKRPPHHILSRLADTLLPIMSRRWLQQLTPLRRYRGKEIDPTGIFQEKKTTQNTEAVTYLQRAQRVIGSRYAHWQRRRFVARSLGCAVKCISGDPPQRKRRTGFSSSTLDKHASLLGDPEKNAP